ncbi:GNAT family N-acetyltransferase, partial [Escherichia coli]|uniref:GNAT family N-acetyltransferase n=1 Tax=Escherichia coli TaxID=562 RepID=UPI00390C5CDA
TNRHIRGAYCLPAHRGKGLYQNLLNLTISVLKKEGYTKLGGNFESFNPTARGFWLKYFTAYTNSVVRRIDERIIHLRLLKCFRY